MTAYICSGPLLLIFASVLETLHSSHPIAMSCDYKHDNNSASFSAPQKLLQPRIEEDADQRSSLTLPRTELVEPTTNPDSSIPSLHDKDVSIVYSHDASASSVCLEMKQLPQQSRFKGLHSRSLLSFHNSFRALLHDWRWELAIWLLGTVGFLAIIALLVHFNGTEQQRWRSSVQITAFVAALAQLSQSALLVPIGSSIGQSKWKWLEMNRKAIDIDRFDLASRGPDGSLRLLWHLGLRPHLVSIGALSTLLMLAFPTFVQQAVAVNRRNIAVLDNGSSYLQRATQPPWFLDTVGSAGTNDFSVYMMQGILNDYTNPVNITGSCSTNLCFWEPYSTLSLCAATTDATNKLVPGNTTSNGTVMPPQIMGPGTTSLLNEKTILYMYTELPERDATSSTKRPPPNGTEVSLPDVANLYILYYDVCKGQNKISPAEENADIRYKNISDVNNWTALKIELRACLQTFNTTYENFWETKILNSTQQLKWHIVIDPTYAVLYCTNLNTPNDFCIAHTFLYGIGESLQTAYDFSSSIRDGQATYTGTRWTSFLYPDIMGSGEDMKNYCGRMPQKKVERRAQNIVASMSIEMRNTGKNARLNGTAWRTEPIIEVTFTWLIMPLVLYTGVTIFFFATILRTRNAPQWKSSALALIQSANPDNKLATRDQFKHFARTASVRLENDGETWRLLESSPREPGKRTFGEYGRHHTR